MSTPTGLRTVGETKRGMGIVAAAHCVPRVTRVFDAHFALSVVQTLSFCRGSRLDEIP